VTRSVSKVGGKIGCFFETTNDNQEKSVRNHPRFREEAHIIEASLTRRFRSFVCSRRVEKSARYAFALAFPSSAGRASSRARGFASSFSFFFPTLKQISKRPNRCYVAFSSIAWRNLFRASAPLRTKKKKTSRGIECRRVFLVRKRQRRRRARACGGWMSSFSVSFSRFHVCFPHWMGEKAYLRSKALFRGPEGVLDIKP